MKELAHQRLPGRDIAIGLHPHAAVRLPFTFPDLLPDTLIDLRTILLDILVKLRLRLQKNVVVKLIHEPQHSGKRPLRLLPRMFQPPQPRHIDVSVPHSVHRDIRLFLHAGQLFGQHLQGLPDRRVKSGLCPGGADPGLAGTVAVAGCPDLTKIVAASGRPDPVAVPVDA